MAEKFGDNWINILILLVIFGGGIVRFIFQNLLSGKNARDPAGQPPQAKSPALEILEKLRQQNQSVAARQAQTPAAGIPAEQARDPEDAYYGDDDLAGAEAIYSTEVTARVEEKSPAAEPRRKTAATIRGPRREVLQPHSMEAGVSAPGTSDMPVRKQELGIEESPAVLTSTRSSVGRGARHLRLPAALGGGMMSLRQAIIGQVILGPPKALEKRAGHRRGGF